jgi:hypothetical protein
MGARTTGRQQFPPRPPPRQATQESGESAAGGAAAGRCLVIVRVATMGMIADWSMACVVSQCMARCGALPLLLRETSGLQGSRGLPGPHGAGRLVGAGEGPHRRPIFLQIEAPVLWCAGSGIGVGCLYCSLYSCYLMLL